MFNLLCYVFLLVLNVFDQSFSLLNMGVSLNTRLLKAVNIIYCIIVLVLESLAYSELCNPPDHTDDIIDNWESLSIYDIVSVSKDSSCPFGYEEINTLGEWPGSEKGCYCSSTGDITEGSCSDSEQQKGCVSSNI